METILISQNCEAELAGSIFAYLDDRNIEYRLVRTFAGESLPDPQQVRAMINLGSPLSVLEYHSHEHLKNLYQFISGYVRTDRPYLGICFGGQILARLMGAKVEPNNVREIGNYQVTLTDEGRSDPLFQGFPQTFSVFHWHRDTFKVPYGATLLATGTDCHNQAFRKGNAVAVQFHVEASAGEIPDWCDTYRHELDEVGKTRDEILTAYAEQAANFRKLNDMILDNFLGQSIS